MQTNTAVKFAPVYSEKKRIDLALEETGAVIKLSTWENDLGWCVQKTMTVDAEMLDELHRVITAARMRIRSQKSNDGQEVIPGKVLDFPKWSEPPA